MNMTKKHEKYTIRVLAVDFLRKIGYYAICNYSTILKGGIFMNKKKNTAVKSAALAAKALTNVLKADANSTACCFVYQPKTPKELSRFRRQK